MSSLSRAGRRDRGEALGRASVEHDEKVDQLDQAERVGHGRLL